MSIRIEVDSADALRVLNALGQSVADLTPQFAEAGRALEGKARDGFRNESDPFGKAWKPLKASTLAGRRARGNSSVAPLFDTGRMFGSIASTSDASSATVTIGGPGIFAATHQRGNDGNTFGGRPAPIPKRPMLPETGQLPDDWAEAALGPFARAIEKAIGS